MSSFKYALVLGAALISGSAFAGVLDQYYEPSYPGAGNMLGTDPQQPRQWIGQTFTAGLSGTLDEVDLPFARHANYNSGITFNVYSVITGGSVQSRSYNNLGALLASVALPATSVPVGVNFGGMWPEENNIFALHIDLTSFDISVVAGQTYAIAVSATDRYVNPDCCNGMLWMGSTVNVTPPITSLGVDQYKAGRQFVVWGDSPAPADSSNFNYAFLNFDLGFKTYVSAVPEPAAPVMMLLGFAGIAGFGVRNRSYHRTAE